MFDDDDAGFAYDLDDYIDPTRMMQDSDDADLGNFFQRPVKIYEKEWGLGITFGEDFDPWSLFFQNKRVINRISNFNLLRCKLHLKFLVNGTPFHYGNVIAAYNPLDVFDDTAPSLTSLINQDLIQLSQKPHIYLNPTTSQGGEMELPFFYHKNYLSVPDSDWAQMGRIYLRTMNDLRHAAGGSDTVTISVFAWAADVSLAVPTSVEPGTLTPQAKEDNIPNKSKGKMKAKKSSKPKNSVSAPSEHTEANTKGMISGPATAVAKAAGALKVIPFLTPYATAAEFAADKTAAIAKLFGYSRPAVTRDPEPYKPVPASSLALTTVPDLANKLSVDDQQALTIDTRIAGVGNEDTLTIKSIAGRETFLTKFIWNTSRNPEELLWNARINPCLWAESGTGPGKAYHIPACCMAAMPFRYWTGSMKFRFQVVKSAYHKGRIKLVYDPKFFGSNEYNTNYLEVIDITDKSDFTVTVGNGQERTLLTHLDLGLDGVTEGYSTTPYTADNKGNGVLGFYVVNKLTTNNETAADEVEVNVFVSMGDDFEVFVPEDKFLDFVYSRSGAPPRDDGCCREILSSQSAEEDIPTAQAPQEDERVPVEPEECQLGPTLQYEEMINRVWTGESIQSFRPLLRRYALHRIFTNADTTDTLINVRQSIFPFLRGYVPGAVDTTATGENYSYVNSNLIHWVVMAHQGWRGGIRRKFLKRGQMDYSTLFVQRAGISDGAEPNYSQAATSPTEYPNTKTANLQAVKSNAWAGNTQGAFTGWQGAAYQVDDINPSLEVEFPFYHWDRFYPGKQLDYTSAGKSMIENFDMRIYSKGLASSAYDCQVAVAEDFQVFFFTGLPRLYREAAPPS